MLWYYSPAGTRINKKLVTISTARSVKQTHQFRCSDQVNASSEVKRSYELYSGIQTFVLSLQRFIEKGHIFTLAVLYWQEFFHDHWVTVRFVYICLKSDRTYFISTNILHYLFHLAGEKHESEITWKTKSGTKLAGKTPTFLILLAKRIFQDLFLIKMAHLKYLLMIFPSQ